MACPWSRKFLGYSVTWDRAAVCLRGGGADTVADLSRYFRGWVAYFRLAEDVDKWVRRKLRGILWRQWKRPRTPIRLERPRAVVERRREPYARRRPLGRVATAWSCELAGGTSAPDALSVNPPRMPAGTSGGVRGEGQQWPSPTR